MKAECKQQGEQKSYEIPTTSLELLLRKL